MSFDLYQYLDTLGDENLAALVGLAARNPASVPSNEVLGQLLLSSLRQEAMLARLVEATDAATISAPADTPRTGRRSART